MKGQNVQPGDVVSDCNICDSLQRFLIIVDSGDERKADNDVLFHLADSPQVFKNQRISMAGINAALFIKEL